MMTSKAKKSEPVELALDAKALAQVEKFNGESNAIATLRDEILQAMPGLMDGLKPAGIPAAIAQAENLRQKALEADLSELALLGRLPSVLEGLRDSARANEALANSATQKAFEAALKTFENEGYQGFQAKNHADRSPAVLEARALASKWSRLAAKYVPGLASQDRRKAELRTRIKAAIVPDLSDFGTPPRINA